MIRPELGDTVEFYKTELSPALSDVAGPIDSLKLTEQRDIALRAEAVATGEIPRGAFADVAIFQESASSRLQNRNRRAAKAGGEVMHILIQRDREAGMQPPKDTAILMAAELHARQEINHAAFVEAARKMRRETAEGELSERNRAIYAGEIDRAQAELYPTVDPLVSNMILGKLADSLPSLDIAALPPDQQGFVSTFLTDYPAVTQERRRAPVPEVSQERVNEFHDQLRARYQHAFDTARLELGTDHLTQDLMPKAMNVFLREIGMPLAADQSDHEHWLCVQDLSFAGFKTSPAKRRIYSGRFGNPTWERFDELALHEAVNHAQRSENGAATGIEALRTGLTGNAMFEEGWALLSEQLLRGKLTQGLARDDFRYLAIAYADGHVDNTPHTETEAYQFTSSFMIAADIAKGSTKPLAELTHAKRRLGYDHIKRTFLGMPPGKTRHANLSYLQGKLDALEFLATTHAPAAEVIDYILQSKFNPLDPAHRKVLQALGMRADIV